MRRSLKLSTRLLTTYAILIAATVFVVAGIVVLLTRTFLMDALDDRLSAAVESFRQGPASEVSTSDELGVRAQEWLARTAFPEDQIVAIRTSDGRVLSSIGTLDLDEIANRRALLEVSEPRWWRVKGPRSSTIRALSVPIALEDRQIGTVVAAASQSQIDETISALLSGIAWAGGIGLVLSAAIGLVVVRRTLRPLERIAGDIRTVQDSGDLSLRVSDAASTDEVGLLASAFNDMLGRLENVFASQRRFLSDASHELRTPLTVARGRLEILARDLSEARKRQSLDPAIEELDRMGRIVEELLLLARLDEGMPLAKETVEVELVVREALLRAMLLERRTTRVDVEDGLFVVADQERLLQVLTNLVTNAIHHTTSDATITISARKEEAAVLIAVADTGSGISAEDLPHIFDRLYRGTDAKKRAPAGAGIGLAIVASLVAAMDGSVDVTSSPGGTTFVVSLPSGTAPDRVAVPG